ncbi:hypothetical protein [Lacicoccus qingdaonensis]|uniref:Uncharacterized protein n=1 Tax=Lacicoccus qingdaonensis TaxID=576118 RepID=A0A1G9F0Y7_9BACL|nr:hypothetical protein [Salinicoccus qingdaonensis]SDK81943.1 hypothetical protein SAMN05216216_11074 [Salinicoccus qingdaonensis]
MKTINDIDMIIFPKTPHDIMYEKLMAQDEITKSDVQSLDMFNDHYIDKLFNAGQRMVCDKMFEAMTREGITTVEPEINKESEQWFTGLDRWR